MNIERGGKIYFSHKELACRSTGVTKLDPQFAIALLDLRITYARPMKVNSCCRSKAHNVEIGGHERSLHVYNFPYHEVDGAAAIDIAWPNNQGDRLDLLRTAVEMGWSVGVAKWGLHLDRRDLAGLPPTAFGYSG
jgi:hypothetical protein